MNTVRANAYAKLNFTLDVTGTEGGYHMLDTLVCTVDLCDRVIVKRRKDSKINVTMYGMGCETLSPEQNNAYLAAQAFRDTFSASGADITVYKNIPVGAGMGGSSADAACVIKSLAALYDISDMPALKTLADGFGSDTGYLLTGGCKRLRGRGEIVEETGIFPEWNIFLLMPARGVSTAACFRTYDETGESVPPRTARVLELLQKGERGEAMRLFGNALYGAACSLEPSVREALTDIKSFAPLGATMSGSGSACFGVFETRELCEWAKSRYRGGCRAYVLKTVPKTGGDFSNPYAVE